MQQNAVKNPKRSHGQQKMSPFSRTNVELALSMIFKIAEKTFVLYTQNVAEIHTNDHIPLLEILALDVTGNDFDNGFRSAAT